MIKTLEGALIAKGKRFGIVASRFNDFITKDLVDGCVDILLRHGVKEEDVSLTWVPGAFEIPLLALKLAKSRSVNAVVCLGTIIRGSTPHFEYIS